MTDNVLLVWDEPKRRANIKRHGLDFAIVTLDFFTDAIVRPAKSGRLQAIGYIEGKPISLVFATLGSEAISLISLRPASATERSLL